MRPLLPPVVWKPRNLQGMNLKITAPSQNKVLDFHLEIQTPSLYLNTTITISGSFGKATLVKIALPTCVIWTAVYDITETILIKGFSDEPVLQLYFPVPLLLEEQAGSFYESPKEPLPFFIDYSIGPLPLIELDKGHKKSLFLHYATGIIGESYKYLIDQLTRAVPSALSKEKQWYRLQIDAPLLLVLQQILFFPLEEAYTYRFLSAKTEELLVYFFKRAESNLKLIQDISTAEMEQLQQVVNVIKSHPHENFTDFQLARKTGINVYTLKKKFKLYTGYTTHQFIIKNRMEIAQSLLKDSDLPIKHIALQLGYKNLSNFSETFKKFFGVSPSFIRKS